ncbi:hypothetical protein T440DRAFT_535017 [Plenodomus tracheiphilus IPT5]|uniref:Gfd2/YDR514C-like C-terminal domain-containing protein n=1 Tax=Plenodomus tracheiphilus IPT5 TaxID=1408161 RepID=A0A6A7AZS8_9PLEO|nr:hypothetical protein T440DRAFT_535017 [Plenodomus tracheiphilus IPT5]
MDDRLQALRDRFSSATDIDVFRHVLGLERLDGIPTIADPIADRVILVCIDCEHWSANTDEVTEVGIARFAMPDMLTVTRSQDEESVFGDHGEELMKMFKINHLRIKNNSHLKSEYQFTQGAKGNRFGYWRFTSFEEMHTILDKVFSEPISDLGCDHPIVVLGVDVSHDTNNMRDKGLKFDLDKLGTVVRTVDSQKLAAEASVWNHSHNTISLSLLVSLLGFEHEQRDPHTAANDAARTLICAVQLALRDHPCKINATKTMQQVADNIETYSKVSFTSLGGDALYCCKCGSVSHEEDNCTTHNQACEECLAKGRIQEAKTHITVHCLSAAKDRSAARRAREDQERPLKRASKAVKKQQQQRLRKRAARARREEEQRPSSTQAPDIPVQPERANGGDLVGWKKPEQLGDTWYTKAWS